MAGMVLLKLEGTGVSPFEQRINYTQTSSWQELRFDMSTATSGVYTLLALFPDIDGTGDSVAWHFDDIQQTTNPHVTGEKPITFETEGADYNWIVFDNTKADNDANAFSVVDNPDPSGINTSSKAGKYVMHVGAAVWAGVKTNSINPIITTENNKWLTMDIYKEDMDTVGLKFEPPSTNGVLVTVVPQTSGQWETLIFDFTEAVGDTFPTFVIFPDWTGLTRSEETIYFDNIAWHSSKPNVTGSKNTKAQAQYSVYPNPATSVLNLKINESEIAEVRIFDIAGCMIYCSKPDQFHTSINVDSFNRGFYTLYVTSKSGITKSIKVILK